MALIVMAFIRMLRRERIEKKEEGQKEYTLPTLRQSLIRSVALVITAFIGFVFLAIMDHFIAAVSRLGGS